MAGTLVGIAAKRQIPSWRGQDLNLRPSGYEPDELPDCSTPRWEFKFTGGQPQSQF